MFHNLPGYAQEERWLFPWVVEIPKEPFLSAQKTGFYKYYIGSFEFPCGFRSSLKSSDSLCCDLRSLDSSNFDNKKFRLNVDTMPLLPPFLPCLGHDNCKMRESTEKSLAPDTTRHCAVNEIVAIVCFAGLRENISGQHKDLWHALHEFDFFSHEQHGHAADCPEQIVCAGRFPGVTRKSG